MSRRRKLAHDIHASFPSRNRHDPDDASSMITPTRFIAAIVSVASFAVPPFKPCQLANASSAAHRIAPRALPTRAASARAASTHASKTHGIYANANTATCAVRNMKNP